MNFVKDDRAKYLFKLLCDETYKEFEKKKKKAVDDELCELLADGYTLSIGNSTIECSANVIDSVSEDSEFYVTAHFKNKEFKTLKGAMNFAENNQ